MPLKPASSSPPPFAWQNEHGPETSLLNSWRPRSTRGAVNRMPVASEMSISARRPSESRKASSAASSPSLGSRKSTPGRRAVVRGKCWTTAPVANSRSEPVPGAPSPDQPSAFFRSRVPPGRIMVKGSTEIVRLSPSRCGTALATGGRSKPSALTLTSASFRRSSGRSRSRRAGLVSATNSGSSGGRAAM